MSTQPTPMHFPIDECAKCTVRGDMGGCLATRCSLHESWHARAQHARITELESQLAQRFDAADMATASAQGFMDGVASAASWISVDERLPEKNTKVLICFAELSIPSTGQYTASALDHEGWCYPQENHLWPGERPDFEDGGSPTVTHWMPLPAAPGPADGESNG